MTSNRNSAYKFTKEVKIMGIFEHFPYTNFHEVNLDWLLAKVKNLETQIADVAEYNSFLDVDNMFIVNVSVGSSSASLDKTFTELQGAIKAGKRVGFKVNYTGSTYNNKPVYPNISFAGVIDSTTELSFTWVETFYNDNIYRRAYAVNINNSNIIELIRRDTIMN